MKAVSIKIYHFSKWTLLVFLVCVALLSLAGRALLENIEYFKNSIVQELADYGIKGVDLEDIEGHWQGVQPVLKIKGASLSIPDRSDALFVNELSLRVKLIPSLLSRDLILESINSSIEKLVLVRDAKGAWWLNDILLSAGNSSRENLDVYGFFQRLPSFVNIDIGLIQLRDLRAGKNYLIQNSALRSSRKKQQLSLELVSRLPSDLGKEIQFILTGDAFNQQLFVKARQLDLVRLFQLISTQKIPLQKALISFRSWVELKRFHIDRMVTKANVTQVGFENNNSQPQALSFSLLHSSRVISNQWQANTEIKNISKGKQKFADIKAQVLIGDQEKPLLWIDQIDLSLLRSILKEVISDGSQLDLLANLQPEALVENVVAELDIATLEDSSFSFNFSHLNVRNHGSIPGVKGLTGSLVSSKGVTGLDINSEKVSMDFGALFRAPLEFDTLSAKAFIQIRDSSVLFEMDKLDASNKDISLQGRLWLEAAAGQRPFASIRANYKNGQIDTVHKYLPVKIMHNSVVKWLDDSLRSGQVPQGDFLFHGRLQKPSVFAKKQSGVMSIPFNVRNAVVVYRPDWPVASQGKGLIEFKNSGMSFNLSQVRYADITAREVNGDIPDFLAANLFLKVKVDSDAKDLLSTLSDLPILNTFDTVKQKTSKISGPISGEVKLDIPLTKKLNKKVSVTAKANLKGAAISIPEWMIEFKEMKGPIEIDNQKVSATALTGKFYDDAIKLNIKPDAKRKRTIFHLTGDVQSRNLLSLTPDYLQHPVSGKSPWDVSVSVSHLAAKKIPRLEIKANSSLQGTQLDYPQPGKVLLTEKRPLNFSAKLFDAGEFSFNLALADDLKANGELNFTTPKSDNLQWLNVYLGGYQKSLEKSGVNIKGNPELIDLNDWFEFKDQYFSAENTGSSSFLQQINLVELNMDEMVLGTQRIKNSKVNIDNNGKFLLGSIDSEQIKGTFELPYKPGKTSPFKAELENLALKQSDSKRKFEVGINNMPSLSITSNKISYDNITVNSLVLKTRSEENHFIIDQLDFSRDKVALKSSGHWQFQPETREHVSVFNINIKGSNFGKTVNGLGLGESIKAGDINFNGQIGWGGELFSMNWPTLIGEADLKLENGFLRNVDPGAGRFVGLLSFNALPKRLFMDFGDVLKEGMHFDKIKGKFSVKGEIMQTESASMDSASAKVKIKGNTNLRRKTYDQTMIIIPRISDTLPVLGTLASGSSVGWGLLLLNRLFKKPIEKSIGIEYKISGSWENPQVTLVKKPIIKQDN
ncbi:MAG: TIGR02099 family protein [Gammaproteobacteria bacterium]|nr:TIGR02099 family protein [Gammaproteobacteria bacterium]